MNVETAIRKFVKAMEELGYVAISVSDEEGVIESNNGGMGPDDVVHAVMATTDLPAVKFRLESGDTAGDYPLFTVVVMAPENNPDEIIVDYTITKGYHDPVEVAIEKTFGG